MTFLQLQNEVKRGALRDQGGTTFDDGVKNVINRSIYRISREAPWRSLRRKSYFDTIIAYSTGSGAGTFTNGSADITVTGATFITDNIAIGRRVKLSGSSFYFTIREITGETTMTLDQPYGGTTTTTGTYSILGQGEYNLPIQAYQRMFLWHEDYGYPYKMVFVTDQDFYNFAWNSTAEAVPTSYRMWGTDMVVTQLIEPSVITIVSTDNTTDVSQQVTIFGTVAGYPDFETLDLNGTTPVVGTKTFQAVERVVKDSSTVGRVTVTGNSGNVTVAVLPVGDTTSGIQYPKVQLYPLPNRVFSMHIQYYKQPYSLVNDGDVHELGEDFDQAIIFLATAILKYENNQDEGDKFLALFTNEMRTLRRVNTDKIDWFAKLRRPKDSVGSNQDVLAHRNLGYGQVGAFYGPRVLP